MNLSPLCLAAAFSLVRVNSHATLLAQDKSLPPPSQVWAAQTSLTTITLVWRGVANAARYYVYGPKAQKGQVRPEVQQLASVGGTVLRYVAQVIAPGMEHRYAIEAVDPKGAVSQKAEFNPVIPQAKQAVSSTAVAPSFLKAEVTGPGEVTLRWDAVPGATAYFIGRSVRPNGLRPLCELCPLETTYVDREVVPGAIHLYSVSSITPTGSSRQVRSNEVTPTSGKEAVAAEDSGSDLPKAPTNIKASVVSPTSVRLTWLPGIGTTSFRIRRTVGSMVPALIATLAGTVSSFLDHLPSGSFAAEIRYEIEAVDAKGNAEKATVAIAPEKAATDTAASTPSPKGLSDLKATVVSPTSVRLTWLPGIGTTSFRIRRTVGSMVPALIATLAGTVSSFLDHLPSGSFAAEIRYEIEAVDAKGNAEKATVAIAPEKAATDTATPDQGGIDSLPRPRGRAP